MVRIAYRLLPKPGGGFHLGREALDQETSSETFPSDSFFAALVALLANLDLPGDVQEMLDYPVHLSSMFPFAGDLLLFPIPRLPIALSGHKGIHARKTLKALRYVSPAILQRVLSGQPMDEWLPYEETPSEGLLLHDGAVWIARNESSLLPGDWTSFGATALRDASIWSIQRTPHVVLDRETTSSQIYHVGRTTFAPGCGLWFLADLDDQQVSWFDHILAFLADTGIGGERAAGYGAFRAQRIEPPIVPPPDGAPRVMTLSRYNPTNDEIAAGVLSEGASYELIDVGGWLATPGGPAQRRKRVRMIEAGSVLVNAIPITGQLVDVKPEYDQLGEPTHGVYRSGLAVTVGVEGGD